MIIIILPIITFLHIWKLRHKELKWLAQSHSVLTSKAPVSNAMLYCLLSSLAVLCETGKVTKPLGMAIRTWENMNWLNKSLNKLHFMWRDGFDVQDILMSKYLVGLWMFSLLTASRMGRCIRTFSKASGRFHTLNKPWIAFVLCCDWPQISTKHLFCAFTLPKLRSSESQILNFKNVTMLHNI